MSIKKGLSDFGRFESCRSLICPFYIFEIKSLLDKQQYINRKKGCKYSHIKRNLSVRILHFLKIGKKSARKFKDCQIYLIPQYIVYKPPKLSISVAYIVGQSFRPLFMSLMDEKAASLNLFEPSCPFLPHGFGSIYFHISSATGSAKTNMKYKDSSLTNIQFFLLFIF